MKNYIEDLKLKRSEELNLKRSEDLKLKGKKGENYAKSYLRYAIDSRHTALNQR